MVLLATQTAYPQPFLVECYDEVNTCLEDSKEFNYKTNMSDIEEDEIEKKTDKTYPDAAVGFLSPVYPQSRDILVEEESDDDDNDSTGSITRDFDQPDIGFLAPLDRKKPLYQNPSPQPRTQIIKDFDKKRYYAIKERYPLPDTLWDTHQTMAPLIQHRPKWLTDLHDFFMFVTKESEFYQVALMLAEMLVDAVEKVSKEPGKVHSLRLSQPDFNPSMFNCWQKLVDGLGFAYEGPDRYVAMEYFHVHTRAEQTESDLKACLALVSALTELGHKDAGSLVNFSEKHAALFLEMVKKLDSSKSEPILGIKTLWKSHKELLKCMGFEKVSEKKKTIYRHDGLTRKLHVGYLLLHTIHGESTTPRTNSKHVIKETSI